MGFMNCESGSMSIMNIMLVLMVCAIIFLFAFDAYTKRKKSGKAAALSRVNAANPKDSGIEQNYIDKDVWAYFTEEQKKSGCFGKKPTHTDAEYDSFILKRINENASKTIALKRIGVDESQVDEVNPICFQGYEEDAGVLGRYGNDGRLRTSQYSVTWVFFSNSQIFVFKIFMDLLTHKTKVVTNEYFYKDITNFSSRFSSYEYEVYTPKKGCLSSGYDTALKKIEIQKFAIIVPGDEFYCSVSGVANIDDIIQGLKQKLRDKKENG